MNIVKNKCSFCSYWSGKSCMVTPNSHYCKRANEEFYQYLQNKKSKQPAQKSLRAWDKR